MTDLLKDLVRFLRYSVGYDLVDGFPRTERLIMIFDIIITMRNFILICLALAVVLSIGGCVVTEEPVKEINQRNRSNKALINGNQSTEESVKEINQSNESKKTVLINENRFCTTECIVDGTCGGPPQYSLRITFVDPSKDDFDTISFSVQDPDNNKDNLLKPGPHPATGNHWDGIGNKLQSETYSLNYLNADEMEIVWKNVETSGNKFSGEGYINIKKLITKTCPEKMWVGGHYAFKGDPDYFCSIEQDYPAQKIFFKCENGSIY
ncbi:MAG: hypothetical protein U9N61_07950 [Euryarchaeota archaeon]|nr:hypothetical protein [Euryarchaeota archaeon]